MKIGFIGAGNMGSALAAAAAKNNNAEIYIYDIDREKAERLAKSLNGSFRESRAIFEKCEYIFLAVKPKFVASVLEEAKPVLDSRIGFTLVSMAAGVKISAIEDIVGPCPIIRIMPNTPVSVGRGVILTAINDCVAESSTFNFFKLMSYAGSIIPTDEELIDAGTAVSGCSPAFAFMFIDALAKGGEAAGLPTDMARELAAKTLIGASELLLSSGKEPSELCAAVCSPAGSTIEGVNHLRENGFEETVSGAVEASYKRTLELGK